MAKSFDELIDWLLGEIVFGGDLGISISQFLTLVDKFYGVGKDTSKDITEDAEFGPTSVVKPNTDHVFKSAVWKWLVARPDIYVGDNREGNKLTLDQILALPVSGVEDSSVIPLADDSLASSPASDAIASTPTSGAPAINFDITATPSSSQRQASDAPESSANKSAATKTKTKRSSKVYVGKKSKLLVQPRIQVSQDRQWRELTGHGVDTRKLPVSEWRLLCCIAATRELGIPQGELIRRSGQDKRSVPRRTDFLAQKGYIEKRQMLYRNQKTSLLTHVKFVDVAKFELDTPVSDLSRMSASELTADLSPVPGHEQWTGTSVDEEALVRAFLIVLRAWGVMQYTHARQKLNVSALPWQMKVLARTTRKLVAIGVIKRVDAKLGNSQQIFKDCIKLGREPTDQDWEVFRKKPTSQNDKGRPRDDVRLLARPIIMAQPAPPKVSQELGDAENSADEDNHDAKSTPRDTLQWTPNKPVGNMLYDTIHAAGTDGLSGMQVRRITVGNSFEKPMYKWLEAYSQAGSQPMHLDHLALVRDVSQTGKNNHYQYFTMPNFQQLVDEGKTSWSNVRDMNTPSESETILELDTFGFPKPDSTIFEGPNGHGTLLEATLSAGAAHVNPKSGRRSQNNESCTLNAGSQEKRPRGRPPNPAKQPRTPKARGRPPKRSTANASPDPDSVELDETAEGQPKRRKLDQDLVRSSPAPRQPPDPNKLHKATFTSYDDMQREEGIPRVYIAPTGSDRFSRIGRQGRPPRSLVAVFKSTRLGEFPWMHHPAPPVRVRALVGNTVGLVNVVGSIEDEEDNTEDGHNITMAADDEDSIVVSTGSASAPPAVKSNAETAAVVNRHSDEGSSDTQELLEEQFTSELREATASIPDANIQINEVQNQNGKNTPFTTTTRDVSQGHQGIAAAVSQHGQPQQASNNQQAETITSDNHEPTAIPQPGLSMPPMKRKRSTTNEDPERARSAKKIALTEAVRALGSSPEKRAQQAPGHASYRSPYDQSSYTSPFKPSPLANEVKLDQSTQTSTSLQTPIPKVNNLLQTMQYSSPFASRLSNPLLGASKSTYSSPYDHTSVTVSPYKSPYAHSAVPTAIPSQPLDIAPVESSPSTSAPQTPSTTRKRGRPSSKKVSDAVQKPTEEEMVADLTEEEMAFARLLEAAAGSSVPENAGRVPAAYDLVGNLILSAEKSKLMFIPTLDPPDDSKILNLEVSRFKKPPVFHEKLSKPSELRILTKDVDGDDERHVFRVARSIESHEAAVVLRDNIIATMTSLGTMPPPKPKLTYKRAPGDGGKPWLCEKCGKRWRNNNGLEYHLMKSNNPCNTNHVAPRPKNGGKTKGRSDSISIADLEKLLSYSRSVIPVEAQSPVEKDSEDTPVPNNDLVEKPAVVSDGDDDDDDYEDSLFGLSSSGRASPQNKKRRRKSSLPHGSNAALSLPYGTTFGPVRLTPWQLHASKPTRATSETALSAMEKSPSPQILQPPPTKSRQSKNTFPRPAAEVPDKVNSPANVNAQRRKDTILEILDANQGVFPGMKSLWFAFVGAWLKKFPSSGNPEIRVVNASAASLIDSSIIRKHEFAFRDSTGRMKTRSILTKNVDPGDHVFIAIKEKVIKAAPEFYVPPDFLPGPELLKKLEATASQHGDRRVTVRTPNKEREAQKAAQPEIQRSTEIEVLAAPFYATVEPKETRYRTRKYPKSAADSLYEQDGDYEEGDDDPYGMSTPSGYPWTEKSSNMKRAWYTDSGERRAKAAADMKAAWASRKAQGLSGKIEPGWKVYDSIYHHELGEQLAQDFYSEYEDDEMPDAGDGDETGQDDDNDDTHHSLGFNGASYEKSEPEGSRKLERNTKQQWKTPTSFLQDATGAWTQKAKLRKRRELKPQLPEPVTLMQTLHNPSWGTHAYGHGVRPIYSRPARRVEGNPKSDTRFEKLLQGHRPVLAPENGRNGPARPSVMLSQKRYDLAGAPPRKKRKYTRRNGGLSKSEADAPFDGIWRLERPGKGVFKPPTRLINAINSVRPLPITATPSRQFVYLDPNTALDEQSTPVTTYPVISSYQHPIRISRFTGTTPLRETEDKGWKNLTEEVFEQLDGSFTIEGCMPSDRYFLSQAVPDSIESIMVVKTGKQVEWEKKPNPRLARFISEVDTVEKYEQGKAMQSLLQGSVEPRYRWIHHTVPDVQSCPELKPNGYEFHDEEQLTWDNPPWDSESNYPDEVDLATIDFRIHGQPRKRDKKAGITVASQKAKDRRQLRGRFTTRRLTQLPQDVENLNKDDLDDNVQVDWDHNKSGHRLRVSANAMSEKDDQRLIVAVIVIRTLTGGLDKNIDWVLVTRLFPGLTLNFVNKRWSSIYQKYRLAIEKLSVEFPEMFLEAYANDELPPFNAEDSLGYDWAFVVDWVLKRSDVSLKEGHSITLPGIRSRLKAVFNIEKKDSDPRWRDVLYGAAPVHRRVDVLTQNAMAAPIKTPPLHNNVELDNLAITRSIIRANCLTPVVVYNSEAALARMNQMGDILIKRALQQLITAKVLHQKNKGRPMPGRAYDTTDFFASVFRRDIKADMLERAAQFKLMLDDNFREGRTVLIDYSAADGDILCITNLQTHGRISLVPSDVPNDRFGLTDGDYMTRQMDKTRLRFKMTLHATSKYIYNEDLETTYCLQPPRASGMAIPIWYDIHGNVMQDMWKKVSAAVLGIFALRTGSNVRDLITVLAPSLEEWELRLFVNWALDMGILREVKGGWATTEWWWWIAGKD